ncbi:MAG: hypothetical protein ACRDWY_04680 [Actinomycetes bacterium]
MFIRSTTIDGDPRRIDEAIAFVRQHVLPAVPRLPGSLGTLLLVNRVDGRTVTCTGWRSAAALRDSVDALGSARDKTARILGGAATVEHWEVAERLRLRRAEAGFAARWTRLQIRPADVDMLVETFRTSAAPALSLLPGFCGTALLVDRPAGRAVTSVTCDSRRSLEDGRREAARTRQVLLDKADAVAVEVVESEVALAAFYQPPNPTS